MKTFSAAQANRQFSSVLREVAHGEIVTVTSRGKPVATISPAQTDDKQRTAAKKLLLVRLNKRAATGTRSWSRDELYGN